MAPLPQYRLRFTFRTFDQCAVDYAGPLITEQRRGNSRQERYLCLFNSLATRAIHLEMAWSHDTGSCLNVFTQSTSHRGEPTDVTSDNDTNFVGAVNELREVVAKLDKDQIQRKTVQMYNTQDTIWQNSRGNDHVHSTCHICCFTTFEMKNYKRRSLEKKVS